MRLNKHYFNQNRITNLSLKTITLKEINFVIFVQKEREREKTCCSLLNSQVTFFHSQNSLCIQFLDIKLVDYNPSFQPKVQ